MSAQVARMAVGDNHAMGQNDASNNQLSGRHMSQPDEGMPEPTRRRPLEVVDEHNASIISNNPTAESPNTDSTRAVLDAQAESQSNNDRNERGANMANQPPKMSNTAPTPTSQSPATQEPRTSGHQSPAPKARPVSQVEPSPGIKRGLSNFFRRSNSHNHNQNAIMFAGLAPTSAPFDRGNSETMLGQKRQTSVTNSSGTSRSTTPPSQSPAESVQGKPSMLEPTSSQFFGKDRNRASSNLSTGGFRERFITFAQPKAKSPTHRHHHRATSMDLETATRERGHHRDSPELTRNEWAISADAGTGLKSRRMSVSLPDDFWVDVVDLHSEFADQSRMIGRRGKTLARTDNAKVSLMTKKGFPNEIYAVKEFRSKNPHESADEHDKKVKSEFSVAKSLHHPNVVETIRLCAHNGRFNHVMEYCAEGDLFRLIQKGYLREDDRLSDRLCLFKQLVQGVHYLHSHGIAHRDIKPENLLITSDSKLKITDFGVSDVFSGIHPGLRQAGGQCGIDMQDVRLSGPGICGSLPFIAPEVFNKQSKYDPRCLDVWSSAVVMIYLVFGGAIWESAEAGKKHYDSLARGWEKWNAKHSPGDRMTDTDYPHVEAFDKRVSPPALRRMLLGMLNPDPRERLTVEQVAGNRWLRTMVECCQVDSFEDPKAGEIIDASKMWGQRLVRVVQHNHLPPSNHVGHRFVRLPGSTAM